MRIGAATGVRSVARQWMRKGGAGVGREGIGRRGGKGLREEGGDSQAGQVAARGQVAASVWRVARADRAGAQNPRGSRGDLPPRSRILCLETHKK